MCTSPSSLLQHHHIVNPPPLLSLTHLHFYVVRLAQLGEYITPLSLPLTVSLLFLHYTTSFLAYAPVSQTLQHGAQQTKTTYQARQQKQSEKRRQGSQEALAWLPQIQGREPQRCSQEQGGKRHVSDTSNYVIRTSL